MIRAEYDTGLPTTGRTQRLKKPPKSDFMAKASEAFGGGMMAMASDAWRCIQQVADIDYMGAAEYEFGSFPKCIQSMLTREYRLWSMVIEAKDVRHGWWRKHAVDRLRKKEIREAKDRGEKPPRLTKKHKERLAEQAKVSALEDHTIWVWSCDDEHPRDVVEQLIRRVANDECRVKAGARFDLDPDPSCETRVFGWVDLDNELCWFTDEDMARGWNELFAESEEQAA